MQTASVLTGAVFVLERGRHMETQRMDLRTLTPADYNPRVELRPGDDEYEALKYSLEHFGQVEPVVWNRRTNRVVGGHQRLTVEQDLGHEEVWVSVVDLDDLKEKELNNSGLDPSRTLFWIVGAEPRGAPPGSLTTK